MRENERIFSLCQLLERNIADEAEAREGYYKILTHYEDMLSNNEIEDLREIIAEELKHSELLARMIYRRTDIVPEE